MKYFICNCIDCIIIQSAGVGVSPPVDLDPSAHEVEPSGVPIGISIQYLTKIYDEASTGCTACIYMYIYHTTIFFCQIIVVVK